MIDVTDVVAVTEASLDLSRLATERTQDAPVIDSVAVLNSATGYRGPLPSADAQPHEGG